MLPTLARQVSSYGNAAKGAGKALKNQIAELGTQGVEALSALRLSCDRTEALVDHNTWPLPKYREMLFLL